MFRLSQYLHALHTNPAENRPQRPVRKPSGPVVIWNLIRRCNLTCKHCYATAADKDFPGELSTQQVFDVMGSSVPSQKCQPRGAKSPANASTMPRVPSIVVAPCVRRPSGSGKGLRRR